MFDDEYYVFDRMECAVENEANPACRDPESVADDLIEQCDEFFSHDPSTLIPLVKKWQEKELKRFYKLQEIINKNNSTPFR